MIMTVLKMMKKIHHSKSKVSRIKVFYFFDFSVAFYSVLSEIFKMLLNYMKCNVKILPVLLSMEPSLFYEMLLSSPRLVFVVCLK